MSSLVSHDKLATLETILKHGRDNKHDKAVDFPCRLFVQLIRNNNDWFVLSCGGGNCMKGVEHGDGGLWCVGCENPVVCPTASFRLELEVTDSTGTAVIVLFDDVVRSLTRTTAGSILAAQSGFSPANSLYATAIAGAYTPVIVNNSDGTKSSLPACLQSLAGRTWDFVLASHTYYHHGDYESFICKIVGSDCFVPAGIASSPPTTPSTSSKPAIVIQTPAKQLEPKSRFSFPDSDSDEDVGSSTNER